jgi:hypothetical protein
VPEHVTIAPSKSRYGAIVWQEDWSEVHDFVKDHWSNKGRWVKLILPKHTTITGLEREEKVIVVKKHHIANNTNDSRVGILRKHIAPTSRTIAKSNREY